MIRVSKIPPERMSGHTEPAICVVTYGDKGCPWLDSLTKSNPQSEIWLIDDLRTGNSKTLWRNSDVPLREFWAKCGETVGSDRLWFLEHDVLVTTALPDARDVLGVAGKDVMVGDGWMWMGERDRLEDGMFPVGIAPLGVSVFSREALDAIVNPRWDSLYEKDVFCELRTPSVVKTCGLPVDHIALPDVRWHRRKSDVRPSIYHSIKGPRR